MIISAEEVESSASEVLYYNTYNEILKREAHEQMKREAILRKVSLANYSILTDLKS